ITMNLAPVVDLMRTRKPTSTGIPASRHVRSRAIRRWWRPSPAAFHASLDAAEPELKAAVWVPFQAVLSVRGVAIMLSHVALTAADTGISVSRSKRVVSGLLRDQWGFDGVAITDDLTMGAVEHAVLCRAVEGALNA